MAVVHPASAGHGLNLQAGGNIIIWFGDLEPGVVSTGQCTTLAARTEGDGNYSSHCGQGILSDETVMMAIGRKENVQAALMNAVQAKYGRVEA